MRELSERFGLVVDPRALVEDIGVGQQQRVEILRVLHRGADVLILDEPTAVLTAQEIGRAVQGAARADRRGRLGDLHHAQAARGAGDRRPRDRAAARQKVGTVDTEGATEASLAKLMVGRDVLFRVEKEAATAGEPDARGRGPRGARTTAACPRCAGYRCASAAGEIVGVAGVDGNGQSELVEAITGLRNPRAASIRVAGTDVTGRGVRGALAAGVGHIAEDRHRRGLVLGFSLAENLALREYRRPPLSRYGLLSPRRMQQQAEPLLEQYDVRGGQPQTLAALALGRQPAEGRDRARAGRGAPVTVAAQPTRGLDVGAIEFVHKRLLEQRDAGRGVLLVSLELEEIRSLSDRVLVIYEGRIVAEVAPDVSDEELGVAMLGGKVRAA